MIANQLSYQVGSYKASGNFCWCIDSDINIIMVTDALKYVDLIDQCMIGCEEKVENVIFSCWQIYNLS